MNNISTFKIKRKGVALVSAIFIAIVGILTTVAMLSISSANTTQITDNRSGSSAYFAAEAGLEQVRNLFNSDPASMGTVLSSLDLPEQDSAYVLNNNASFWVDSIAYSNNNKTASVDIIGKYNDSFRKIRAVLDTSIPNIYNNYGLLTDGILTIHGTKILRMNVHANNGLSFTGGTTMENNAVATQSLDPTAGTPNFQYNAIGGYVPRLDVPVVPIDEYRTKGQQDGVLLNINQDDLMTQINNAPAGSNIYISGTNRRSVLSLSGNMQGKFIFVDGDIKIAARGMSNLSNVMVVAAGSMTVGGSTDNVDVGTSHTGQIDTIFASADNVTLDGSRSFDSLFWTNQTFTQNGASLAGRVISQEAILFNGAFTLSQSNELYDNGAFDNVINVSTWRVVPLNS